VSDSRHRAAAGGLLQVPVQLVLETGHGRRSRNAGTVDEHRRVEIAGREHLCDVAEVVPDLVAGLRVPQVVRANIDSPAISVQFEMVGGLLVREALRGPRNCPSQPLI
jgi:hypothetical protein